jgi:hypothetical protein
VISGFRREVAENCALQGYYAASSDNFLLTFRDNLSVPSSGFKNLLILVRNNHYSLRKHTEERSSKVFVFQKPEQDKFASLRVRDIWNKKGAAK